MKQKTALITGASGGIGSEIARKLASDGWRVVACYHTNPHAAGVLCEQLGNAVPVMCDVRDGESCRAAALTAQSLGGTLDLVVNCAGISVIETVDMTTDEQYDAVFDVNMRGVFNMTRAAAPIMIRQKYGAIINIGSMWGVAGASCETVYSASKAAVIGFTRAVAKELAPSGIRVNCIAPGVIATPMNEGLDLDNLARETPLGIIGSATDIAEAVAYFAEARFVTGQTLTADGGFTL